MVTLCLTFWWTVKPWLIMNVKQKWQFHTLLLRQGFVRLVKSSQFIRISTIQTHILTKHLSRSYNFWSKSGYLVIITTGGYGNANSLSYQIHKRKAQENDLVVIILNYFSAKFPWLFSKLLTSSKIKLHISSF